jgi:hypothetical protein
VGSKKYHAGKLCMCSRLWRTEGLSITVNTRRKRQKVLEVTGTIHLRVGRRRVCIQAYIGRRPESRGLEANAMDA